MSAEANRATVLRYAQEVWNNRNLEVADELIAPTFTHHTLDYQGPDAIKSDLASIHTAFPDAAWTLEETLADGDKVTLRFTFRGTQDGSFMGVPGTGKQVEIPAITIYQLAGGQIIEEWAVLDFHRMMTQLGYSYQLDEVAS